MITIEDIKNKSIATINTEMVKFTKEDQQIVSKFCLETSLYRKLHTLFTASELYSITDQVFTDSVIRDFVLDLTDKLSIALNLGHGNNSELENYFADAIGNYPTSNDVILTETLIPTRILNNVCIFKDEILTSLVNNKWLMTIVLINLYFFDTNFFDTEQIQQTMLNKPAIEAKQGQQK